MNHEEWKDKLAEMGECESAYILLKNLDLIKEIDYIEMGQFCFMLK